MAFPKYFIYQRGSESLSAEGNDQIVGGCAENAQCLDIFNPSSQLSSLVAGLSFQTRLPMEIEMEGNFES